MEYAQSILLSILFIVSIHSVTSQTEIHLEYDLYEESLAGDFVGNVGFDAFAEDSSSFTYSIFTQRSDYPDYFMISRNRGVLETSGRLDRDSISECIHQEVCTVDITVAAQNIDTEIIRIIVTLLDLNDNAPNFSQAQITRTLPENTPVGRSIQIEAAEDPDSPGYSISRYALLTGAPVFSLRADRTSENFDVWLVLEQPLDREGISHYPVTIAAYDGNTDGTVGMLNVDVVITDVNDNSPIFTSNNYRRTLPENVEIGSTVIGVTATDADEGINGQIVYSFTDRTQHDYGSIFFINNRTGDISIIGPLSHDHTSEYSLVVEAKDMDPVSIPASTRVVISVQDVNDHAPGKQRGY